MTDPAVPLGEWLRGLGELVSGRMPIAEAKTKLAAYGQQLGQHFPASAFTRNSLEAVAGRCKGFPTYGLVRTALADFWRDNRPAPTRPAIDGGAQPGAGYWHGFIASRLVGGGDRAHLLSLAKRYAEPDELRGIMAAFYSTELAAEEAHAAEVRRDKARAAESVAAAVAAALRSPDARRPKPTPDQPARPAAPEPPVAREGARASQSAPDDNPPPPADPHEPGRPLTLDELRARLARFEREAASNDPPPNAAQRIAWLRERIATEEPAA